MRALFSVGLLIVMLTSCGGESQSGHRRDSFVPVEGVKIADVTLPLTEDQQRWFWRGVTPMLDEDGRVESGSLVLFEDFFSAAAIKDYEIRVVIARDFPANRRDFWERYGQLKKTPVREGAGYERLDGAELHGVTTYIFPDVTLFHKPLVVQETKGRDAAGNDYLSIKSSTSLSDFVSLVVFCKINEGELHLLPDVYKIIESELKLEGLTISESNDWLVESR